MEQWIVFFEKKTGRELCSYTIRGTFPGEKEETIKLLAYEEGIDPADIETRTERR